MTVTELDELAAVIASTIKDATDPLLARIAELEKAHEQLGNCQPVALTGPQGPAGKDAEPVNLAEVARMAAALVPVPKDGKDGIDGKDATIDLQALATAAAALVPVPRDGRDGMTGQPGPPGRDGAKGADGLNGKDGKDGMGFTHLEASYEPETAELVHRYIGIDGEVKEHRWKTAVPRYRGIYEHGKTYEAGESVTYSGSLWITGQTTQAKPGGSDAESRAWRLAVKKGTDGKGEKGDRGEQGPMGPKGDKGENRY